MASRNITEFETKYIMDVITSQAFGNISGNLRKISGNIKFTENSQP